MKLGIGTYTYGWSIGMGSQLPKKPFTPFDILEKAENFKVKLVQMGPNLPMQTLPEKDLDAWVKKAKSLGLSVELATRGLEKEHLEGQIALAKKVGAKLIRTIAELGGAALTGAECVAPLKKVMPLFESAQVQLAIENGKIPAADMRKFMDDFNSPYLGAVLDTTNSLAIPEGYKEVARELAPHVMCLHMKDFSIRRYWHLQGFIQEGMPAGQGMVDFPWLLKTAKQSKYDFNVILELHAPQMPTAEESAKLEQRWAEESVPFLRGYIKE